MNSEDLTDEIYDALEGNYGDTQSVTKLNDNDSPVNVDKWVSTGCAPLDIACSNRKNGGAPIGVLSQIRGGSSTGKSLLLATILANAQKKGYISVLFDNEFSADKTFFEAIGMDSENLVYANLEYVEDVLSGIDDVITSARENNNNKPILIGIDSIANLKSRQDQGSGYEKDGYATSKAIILSQKLPKILPKLAKHDVGLICTQQMRANVGVTFGPSEVPASGGKAIDYASSLIIRLRNKGYIKTKDDLIVGQKVKAKVKKSRLGPPKRTAKFEIYFDSGIDDVKSCLEQLEDYGVVDGKAWKYFTEDLNLPGVDLEKRDENEYGPKFQTKRWRKWMKNEEAYNKVVDKIAELNIMKYKGHMESDDTRVEQNDDDEDEDENNNNNKR